MTMSVCLVTMTVTDWVQSGSVKIHWDPSGVSGLHELVHQASPWHPMESAAQRVLRDINLIREESVLVRIWCCFMQIS